MIPQSQSKLELLKLLTTECIKFMKEIDIQHPQQIGIQNAYASTLNYLSKTEEASGGCHFISTMLYILLVEQGIECDIVVGEVEDYEKGIKFSHSWVEIEGAIYDPAIMHTLDGAVNPPVYYGICLTYEALEREYGVSDSRDELDRDAKQVLTKSVTVYLDEIAKHGFSKNYLWDEILKAGTGILGYTNLSRLRKKYHGHFRRLKTWNEEV
ncbi:hypothetical protein [Neobacillus sp. D3-1R]|uniref:hypothetical protein n=1 Tax=Neobacillus sp. D3-1R TaxID=3445778 RepID=UPI003F9FDAEA